MAFDPDKPYVLLIRHNGGYGDIICASVPVRAARKRYPKYQTVWALNSIGQPLFSDQDVADEVISPYPWDESMAPWIKKAALVILFDGPEQQYAKRVKWDLKKSRIEVWCEAADVKPKDMRPRWRSRKEERNRIITWGQKQGREPGNYVVLQWRSADSCKDYPHNRELLRLLTQAGIHVVVATDEPIPNLKVKCALSWPSRYYATLIEQAALTIGPDTFITHLSAATDTPYLGLFATTNPEVYCKHYPLAQWLWNKNVIGKDCAATFPCYNLRDRGWWCQHRQNHAPWCLEQIDAGQVCDKVLAMLKQHKGRNARKIKFLMEGLNPDMAGPPARWYEKDEFLAQQPESFLGQNGSRGIVFG